MHVALAARLPHVCALTASARWMATQASSSELYPWPKGRRPSAHAIFHFTEGARPSKAEVKARYYELVRAHHPDTSALAPELARARFQALADAYDVLSGRRHRGPPQHAHARERHLTPEEEAELERRRAYHRAKRADMSAGAAKEAVKVRPLVVWGEGVLLSLGTLLFLAFAFPYGVLRHHSRVATEFEVREGKHERARKALEDAEEARRQTGQARREEIGRMLDDMRMREEEEARLGESPRDDDGPRRPA